MSAEKRRRINKFLQHIHADRVHESLGNFSIVLADVVDGGGGGRGSTIFV